MSLSVHAPALSQTKNRARDRQRTGPEARG